MYLGMYEEVWSWSDLQQVLRVRVFLSSRAWGLNLYILHVYMYEYMKCTAQLIESRLDLEFYMAM